MDNCATYELYYKIGQVRHLMLTVRRREEDIIESYNTGHDHRTNIKDR